MLMFYYWATLPQIIPYPGQICWVRCVDSFFNPFLAEWNLPSESFISIQSGLSYPKELIARWKEVPELPGKSLQFVSDNNPLNPLRIDINGVKYFKYSISWGDGQQTTGYFTGSVLSFTHTYAVANNYNVTISTPSASITYLRIANEPLVNVLPDFTDFIYLTELQLLNCGITGPFLPALPFPDLTILNLRNNVLTGNFPSVVNCPGLSSIIARNNQLTGNLPDFSILPDLFHVELDSNQFTGNVPSLSNCPLLSVLRLAVNTLSGSLPSLSNCPALDNLYITNSGLSGVLPSFTNNVILRSVQVDSNNFTGYTASTIALTCVTFLAQNNALPVASINQILADFAANIANRPTVGTLNLSGGTNAAPTGQGLIDRAAIIARGWTVTTN